MSFAGKHYWLVGASEGLGLALARQMRAAGAEVILSARNADRLAGGALGARTVVVDVAGADSVTGAAEQVGRVDGVVFLAGVYWPMTAQSVDAAQLQACAM